jgi:hypothetical protein
VVREHVPHDLKILNSSMFILWPIELILVHIPQKPENNVDAAIVE